MTNSARDEDHLQAEFERYYGSPIVSWERWEAWQWGIDAMKCRCKELETELKLANEEISNCHAWYSKRQERIRVLEETLKQERAAPSGPRNGLSPQANTEARHGN